MSYADREYYDLLNHVAAFGHRRKDRTGTGTQGVFGYQMRFPLDYDFPLLTTKRIHWKSVVEELLWFIRGETNVRSLQEKGVTIWDEWADENGELGPVYGKQWRDWSGIDQLHDVIERIKKDPFGRRHLVSAWNPVDVPEMKLPPCHCLFQFYVDDEDRLSCQLYQRSADVFLGVPFNIASYSLLTMMVAQVTGYKPGDFIWTGGDVHIYRNHFEQVREQMDREPRPGPKVLLDTSIKNIDDFTSESITLVGYNPHPAIKAEVAI